MSSQEEQKKSSPDLEQILSERDALRGMNDSLTEELDLVHDQVETLLTFAAIFSVVSIQNEPILFRAYTTLKRIGMGPQLDALSDLLGYKLIEHEDEVLAIPVTVN